MAIHSGALNCPWKKNRRVRSSRACAIAASASAFLLG